MEFRVTWDNLLDNVEELPADATLLTPLSQKPFHITDVQQHRVLIEYQGDSETVALQREQFETLFERVDDATGSFDLDRLPPGAEPYATVMSLHPRFTIDDRDGTLSESETPTPSPLVEAHTVEHDDGPREEPDIPVYADALLLIDALEQHDVTSLTELDVPTLVNLYTLLSDVQRNANDLRQEVRGVLLDRLHHDQPVSGQYGSVQRAVRRNRTLKDDEAVLELLEAEGIDPERVMSVDTSKLDDALEVTSLSESDVYEIEESEYVRKADVDEEMKPVSKGSKTSWLEPTKTQPSSKLKSKNWSSVLPSSLALTPGHPSILVQLVGSRRLGGYCHGRDCGRTVLSYSLGDDRPATATGQMVYPDRTQVGFYQ